MVAALVVLEDTHEMVERVGIQLAVFVGQSDHLVPAGLYGSRLVHVDVRRGRTYYALIRT